MSHPSNTNHTRPPPRARQPAPTQRESRSGSELATLPLIAQGDSQWEGLRPSVLVRRASDRASWKTPPAPSRRHHPSSILACPRRVRSTAAIRSSLV
jgi:hypothetical protein